MGPSIRGKCQRTVLISITHDRVLVRQALVMCVVQGENFSHEAVCKLITIGLDGVDTLF